MKLFSIMFVVLMCAAMCFVATGCDEERDGFKRPYLEVTDSRCFTPTKKIFVWFPWPPHFEWVLEDCDVEEIKCLLTSEDDWRVEGQENDGDESFYVVDSYTFHIGGFTIDIRCEVKLQLWTITRPNGHYPDGYGGYTDEVIREGLEN